MKTLLNIAALAFAALLASALVGKPLFKRDPDEAPAVKSCQAAELPRSREYLEVHKSHRANGLTKFHFRNKRIHLEIWAKDLETATRKFQKKTKALTVYRLDISFSPWPNRYLLEAEFAV